MSSKSRVDEIADDLLMCDESSHWDDRQILIEMARALLEEARKIEVTDGYGEKCVTIRQLEALFNSSTSSNSSPTPQRTTEEG